MKSVLHVALMQLNIIMIITSRAPSWSIEHIKFYKMNDSRKTCHSWPSSCSSSWNIADLCSEMAPFHPIHVLDYGHHFWWVCRQWQGLCLLNLCSKISESVCCIRMGIVLLDLEFMYMSKWIKSERTFFKLSLLVMNMIYNVLNEKKMPSLYY